MKRLFLGITTGVTFFCLSIVVSLLLTPYVLGKLGRDEYAVFYLVNNFIVWFGLLRVGQSGSFRFQLSLYAYRRKYINALFSTLIFFYCCLAVVFFSTGFLLCDPILKWINVPSLYFSDATMVYFVLLANFSVSTISFLFSNVLEVFNKEYIVNLIKLVLLIVQTFMTIFLLKSNYGLLALAIPTLLTSIIALLSFLYLVYLQPNKPDFKFTLISVGILKKSLSIGKWFFLGFVAQLLIKHTDIVLIGKFIDFKSVTSFLMTCKLYVISIGVCQMIIKTVHPQILKLSRNNKVLYDSIIGLYVELLITFFLFVGSILYIGNAYVLKIWIGNSFFLGRTVNFLLFLIFGMVIINQSLRSVMKSRQDITRLKKQELIEGILKLALSVVLCYFYKIEGLLWATLLSSCFILFTYILTSTRDEINRMYNGKNRLRWFALFIVAVYSTSYIYEQIVEPQWMGISLFAFCLSLLVYCFSHNNIKQFSSILYRK